jgi:hypothetical protein
MTAAISSLDVSLLEPFRVSQLAVLSVLNLGFVTKMHFSNSVQKRNFGCTKRVISGVKNCGLSLRCHISMDISPI